MKEHILWQWKTFDELRLRELYDILALRARVFVVEQECAYQDIDGVDTSCLHLLGMNGENVVAYLRVILPQGDGGPKIGRVVVAQPYRGCGFARQAVIRGVEYCEEHFSGQELSLAGQTYLIHFYTSLGFTAEGSPYDEDGIEHIDMFYKLP